MSECESLPRRSKCESPTERVWLELVGRLRELGFVREGGESLRVSECVRRLREAPACVYNLFVLHTGTPLLLMHFEAVVYTSSLLLLTCL